MEVTWHPIESAPKDGTRFVAMVNDRPRVVRWCKATNAPAYGFCLADQGVQEMVLCNPTHWKPPAAVGLARPVRE